MALCSASLFLLANVANMWLFSRLQFMDGVHWIYLPAGVRLLCVLLFSGAGAVGLLLAGWVSSYAWYFPGDFIRALGGGFLSAAGPYLAFRLAQWRYGLHQSLAELTAWRLLMVALACSLITPALTHVWFAWTGLQVDLYSLFVMFMGDLLGTLLVLYSLRLLLVMVPSRRTRP